MNDYKDYKYEIELNLYIIKCNLIEVFSALIKTVILYMILYFVCFILGF